MPLRIFLFGHKGKISGQNALYRTKRKIKTSMIAKVRYGGTESIETATLEHHRALPFVITWII